MKFIRLGLVVAILAWTLSLGGGSGGTSQPKPPSPTTLPEPQVLRVCPDGPPACEFSKISEAIQKARPNDFLQLHQGAYKENLLIDKSLQFVAAEAGRVRIQGAQPGRPTIVLQTQEDLRVVFQGVVIVGGPVAGSQEACLNKTKGICPDGIALSGEGSVVLTLVDSTIMQAATGLSCPPTLRSQGSAQVTLLNSHITNNSNFGIWWGQDCIWTANLYLEQTTFSGNWNGILLELGNKLNRIFLKVEGSRFVGNRGAGLGSSLNGDSSRIIIRNSWFLHNSIGAAIYTYQGSSTEIRDSYFIGNVFGLDIRNSEGFILLEDSVISGNSEVGLYPRIQTQGQIEIRNNLIEGNGWGVFVVRADEPLWFEDNRILRNRKWGIGIFRPPCADVTQDYRLRLVSPYVFIQGEGNDIRDNSEGNLCPDDYNWPPNFRKP